VAETIKRAALTIFSLVFLKITFQYFAGMKSLSKFFLIVTALTFLTSTAQSQTVSTLASLNLGRLGDGLIQGPNGDLFLSQGYNGNKVFRITLDGQVTEFATGLQGAVGTGFDSLGNLYVNSYSGGFLYIIDPQGGASVFASGLDGPAGIVVTPDDELIVSEFGGGLSGQGMSVTKIDAEGTVTPFVYASGLIDPIGIARDEAGIVYVANWSSGRIFKIMANGDVTFLADIGGSINQMTYANGVLYVPSPGQNKIFTVTTSGEVSLLAGTGAFGGVDGDALQASFQRPNSIAASVTGDTLFVADAGSGVIRMIELNPGSAVGTESGVLPKRDLLDQNYPNPFNSTTSISYSLDEPGFVSLKVYDSLGREVRVLVDSVQSAQEYVVRFEGDDLSNGVYLYRLSTANHSEARAMLLNRAD